MPQIITAAINNTRRFGLSVPTSGANTPSIGHWRIQRLNLARDQSGDALTNGGIDLNYQPQPLGKIAR
jgi:hypothetical protein